ncbi:secretin N-terminal domain-containing protein [Yersinia enterocolitica]|uniref:secretin N-terminal domain-containing protein n=1 Tax=Yersinia TaxID=629 RepID=UPI00094BC306|nr:MULTISPECIES: secretin N-terminal domain-containing protein [Yersinia]EKN4037911.1 secretin [Yersinia enterocolitica]MBW5812576.1 secretin [Yersinia kristensenii]MBW5817954.1 secretin [Yersinia kristensenii]MBW5829877.1 secretin [Yersinia kristensenii]MBW5842270.1 secretin [Yersinia kristensenii]
MKSNVIFFLILLLFGVTVNAQVMLKKNEMSLKEALIAIAKDEQLKLVDSLDEKTSRQPLTQVLSGEGQVLLAKLSDVYDFDWYIYGGTINVQTGQQYINYTYKPKNIAPEILLMELEYAIQTNSTLKMKLIERGNSLIFSGPRNFINDVLSYSNMADSNEFLENGNDLEIARIEFDYLSVIDRNINTFDGQVNFPGAASLISGALSNMGQFENVADGEMQERAYKVKLNGGDKQKLDEAEKTSKVQAIPGTNALLIRGTPDEITLAKRIGTMIDVKGKQLMFSLKVYDVAADRTESFGANNTLLNGSKGLYDILTLPYSATKDFLNNFQAMYSNGLARSVYSTNLLILENHQGHFGKKDTITVNLVSNKEVESLKIEADNSLYVTGRVLPNGGVQAKLEYVEEHFEGDGNNNKQSGVSTPPRVSSQSLSSEAYIKPNETIVLGGFDNTETESSESGVPVLSSIPLIGEVFKSTKSTKRKFKRYIAVSFQVIE